MHKLLKAKQDLIEIQKKRIEYLTNRNLTNSTYVSSASSSTNTHKQNVQQQQQQQQQVPNQALNYNQYAHQPKIRQINRSQIRTQTSITPSASNPSIHTAAITANDYSSMRKSNLNLDKLTNRQLEAASVSPATHTKTPKPGSASEKQPIASIAASPSSSSTSMTQFCSYLAASSLNPNGNLALDQQFKKPKSKSSVVAVGSTALNVDHSSSSASSSSSSSSSSAISSISSHQTPHLVESLFHPEVNFLRTSEL